MSNFETWWEREGQEFLYALNTTTDDDIKLVAEVAWKNGAYCAEQAEQEPVGRWNWNEAKFEWLTKFDYHKHHMTPLYAAPQPVKQEPVHEALQIASVALQDIACSSQTENLYWWQLRARKAQKQIAERLINAAPVQQAEQEPKELVPVLAGFDRSKYTKEQWDWCWEYLSITDYEPMMCDFEYGTHTFYEAVQASVQWYEDHTSDMHLKISKTVGKFDPEKEVDYD